MNEQNSMQPWSRLFFHLPQTAQGRWSIVMSLGFALFLGLFYLLIAMGQRGGETFFSNPWLAISILLAAFSALSAGTLAVIGIIWKHERSVFAFAALLLGVFVLYFLLGEILFPH